MKFTLPDSPHCPRCGLREPHECLDPRAVIRAGSPSSEAERYGAGRFGDHAPRRPERKTQSLVVR